MIKNIIVKIINTISVIVIVFAILVLGTVFLTKSGEAPSFAGYSMFRVMTGSMEPVIPTDSMIVVKISEPDEIEVGDVISFYSTEVTINGFVNTHRVIAIDKENGEYAFTTKGDANKVEDKEKAYGRNLIGKVVFTSLLLGRIVRITSNPLVFIPLIFVPLALILLSNLLSTVKTAKELAKEEMQIVQEEIEQIRKADAETADDADEGEQVTSESELQRRAKRLIDGKTAEELAYIRLKNTEEEY